jgi:hypothetical protein
MEGADIETAIRDIRGTSVAHLEPNRTKGEIKSNKIIKEYFIFLTYFRPK